MPILGRRIYIEIDIKNIFLFFHFFSYKMEYALFSIYIVSIVVYFD